MGKALCRRKRLLSAVLGSVVGFSAAWLAVPDGFGGIGLRIVMVVGVMRALTISGAMVGWWRTAKS